MKVEVKASKGKARQQWGEHVIKVGGRKVGSISSDPCSSRFIFISECPATAGLNWMEFNTVACCSYFFKSRFGEV